MPESANLFTGLPSNLPEELIEKLVDAPGVRIERIVSTGHASPPEFWYDQSETEWVVLLRGEAVLAFEDETKVVLLIWCRFFATPEGKSPEIQRYRAQYLYRFSNTRKTKCYSKSDEMTEIALNLLLKKLNNKTIHD